MLQEAAVFYRRNLPHWHPEGQALFITWRLYGSVPAPLRSRLPRKRKLTAGERFVAEDRAFDKAEAGPLWLKDPRIARIVAETLERGDRELGQYILYAFAIMANHVHALLEPRAPLRRITNGIKGVTARAANRLLKRTGRRFWQDESFDHWVRDAAEFERIRRYIEQNPVAAGLVEKPEDWPWSSAARRFAPERS